MSASLLARLDAHDRAVLVRCAQRPASRATQLGWCALTHLGGTAVTVAAAALPALACCRWDRLARFALATLIISHLLVQAMKRVIGRGRPSRVNHLAAIREPDRFSFPSGHATASLPVALSYGVAIPLLAGPLVIVALLVGYSRVRLGVHYPSDVLAGQLLAIISAVAVSVWL
jgi:undecaprenyl-diphosphatase